MQEKMMSQQPSVYKRFAIQGNEPTAEEWEQIEAMVFELYPQFHSFLQTHSSLLNYKEEKTCILIRAGFKPKMISELLHVCPSYISNIRKEMLQRLFKMKGRPKDFDQLLRAIT